MNEKLQKIKELLEIPSSRSEKALGRNLFEKWHSENQITLPKFKVHVAYTVSYIMGGGESKRIVCGNLVYLGRAQIKDVWDPALGDMDTVFIHPESKLLLFKVNSCRNTILEESDILEAYEPRT